MPSRQMIVPGTWLAALVLLAALTPHAIGQTPAAERARQIVAQSGVSGGFVVHLGCGDGALTAALRINSGVMVHGLDTDDKTVAAARRSILDAGKYGDVSFDRFDGRHLPYIDNMVNLIVADKAYDVSQQEMMRVLAPRGVILTREGDTWRKTVKPVPTDIDDWTHYLYDSSGNAVAHDTAVGAPRYLQWLGSPKWSRHHDRMASMSALVSAAGRMFYILDEGSRVSIQMPPDWQLVARDGFNGVVLWKRPLENWFSHLWPLKSGPTQLARRLVATEDRVYATMSLHAPVAALDARTGETIRVYEDTKATEEIILHDGVLVLLVREGKWELDDYKPELNLGDQGRVARQYQWNQKPRRVMAVDAESGRKRWERTSPVAPLTLAADAKRVYFHDGDKVICLDKKSGELKWETDKAPRRSNVTFNFGPKLVIHGGTVLFAGGDRTMQAYNADSGQKVWESAHERGGYLSPEDLLVVNGIVWSAPTTSGRDSGVWTGRDIKTGRIKAEFPPNVDTYWFHHRCYIAKATDKYIMPSRTGIEFVDPDKGQWEIHHWVRGGCLYGVLPCNGLLYAPPHNCACYPEAKLFGFNAMAAMRSKPPESVESSRLEKGPAYDSTVDAGVAPGDWPTFRADTTRSGNAAAAVPAKLTQAWSTKLGGELSAMTIAAGRAYVAQKNAHTVYALSADTGDVLWRYTAGGRVDSPPTIHEGLALFGSADGYIYCLRADDGRLVWRFRAAPHDRRLMSFEQLESTWPVSGSVLIQDGVLYAIAGRSLFMDNGMRFLKLDPRTGEKLLEKEMDETDPETGKNLQERLQVLQMPVGLPDILSSDGKQVYMRSQVFDFEGNRPELGPHTGDFAGQGSVQQGQTAHLFSPTGYLDDSWFHRAYWVYGRSFAGGHAGYYQAGKFAPAGRIMVHDKDRVYGFCRKPQYYKWTTILEHHLFGAPRDQSEAGDKLDAPDVNEPGGDSIVRFENTKTLDPTNTPLAVEAWVNAQKPNGVIIARGGPAQGFALVLDKGRPQFHVRAANELFTVAGKKRIVGEWTHLAGVLDADKKLHIFVNGELEGTAQAKSFIASDPAQAMQIGADETSAVGEYQSPHAFTGAIDEVRLFIGTVTAAEIKQHHDNPDSAAAEKARLVLSLSFNRGSASDASGQANHGKNDGAKSAKGVRGAGLAFSGNVGRRAANARGGAYEVKHHWTQDVSLFAYAMLLADKNLFVAGPPDIIDEESTFATYTEAATQAKLAEQDALLDGKDGSRLLVVSTENGAVIAEYKLEGLPTWDGMAAARGALFMTMQDGRVVCFRGDE